MQWLRRLSVGAAIAVSAAWGVSPALSPARADERPLTVVVVNATGWPDEQVFLTLDPGGSGPLGLAGGPPAFAPGFGHGTALTSLHGDGTVPASHTYTFDVSGPVTSGRLYYSRSRALGSAPNAENEPTRYDYAEFTTDGRGAFNGDLTAIDQIAIPASIAILDDAGSVMANAPGSAQRTIGCVDHVLAELTRNAPPGWDPATTVMRTGSGSFLRIVGPNAGPAAAARYPSLKAFVQSLAGQTITIRGRFAGGGAAGNATDYDYAGTITTEGDILLSGTLTGGGYTPRALSVRGGDLWGAETPGFSGYGIYLQNGPYRLDGGDPMAVQNDVYGWLYGDLVTAFAYGYWGGKYGNTSNAYTGQPAFEAARTGSAPFASWSLYEQAIWQTSDSYGMPLGERFESAGKPSPDIGVGPNPPAASMQLTLLANNGCPQNSGPSPAPGPSAPALPNSPPRPYPDSDPVAPPLPATSPGPASAPSPSPSPSKRLQQRPIGNVTLPRHLASSGRTVLLRHELRTNAGQAVTVRASCRSAELSAAKAPPAKRCRVVRGKHGRSLLIVRTHKRLRVTVTLSAPGVGGYLSFALTKVYPHYLSR